MNNVTYDTTRRTVTTGRRMPQWQRLMSSVERAGAEAGHEGKRWGAAEVEHFGIELVGVPVERVQQTEREFAAYWVERHANVDRHGALVVVYKVYAVYGDDLANVHSLTDITADNLMFDPTAAEDDAAALDAVKRSHFITGGAR